MGYGADDTKKQARYGVQLRSAAFPSPAEAGFAKAGADSLPNRIGTFLILAKIA